MDDLEQRWLEKTFRGYEILAICLVITFPCFHSDRYKGVVPLERIAHDKKLINFIGNSQKIEISTFGSVPLPKEILELLY